MTWRTKKSWILWYPQEPKTIVYFGTLKNQKQLYTLGTHLHQRKQPKTVGYFGTLKNQKKLYTCVVSIFWEWSYWSDFWKGLPPDCVSPTPPDWQKFSKVSSRLDLLQKMNIKLSFENYCHLPGCQPTPPEWLEFSKVSSRLHWRLVAPRIDKMLLNRQQ